MFGMELDSLRAVLNRNADVFSISEADIGCCSFVEHEIEIDEGSMNHREGVRRMTPHIIERSKSPWACSVVMAKKKQKEAT